MSLLDEASLVQIPSGYKEDKLYSIIPSDGSGDFNFSRASTATRVNAEGLIEEMPYNLLQQSNTFNTTWASVNSGSVTGGQSGYDGSSNAWLLTKAATHFSGIRQSVSVSGVHTFSIIAKAGSLNFLWLEEYIGASIYFDLINGTTSGSGAISSSMTSLGGNWWRCELVSDNSITIASFYPQATGSPSSTSGNILIQDAQVNSGSTAKPYFPTTDRLNVPRIDYTGGCGKLLLEPQRTNVATYSNDFSNAAWIKTNSTITANTTTSPDGTQNASTLVISSSGYLLRQYTASVSAGGSWALSIFAKNQTTNFLRFGGATPSGTDTYSIQDMGNGWYRHSLVRTFASAYASFNLQLIINEVATHYIWGGQIEQGYATSYIPTASATVTRLVDSANSLNDSLSGGQVGSFFVELVKLGNDADASGSAISITDNSGGEEIRLHFDTPANTVRFRDANNGFANIGGFFAVTNNTAFKMAFSSNGTKIAVFGNGSQIGGDYTIANPLSFDKIIINGRMFKINQLLYFPTALSDTELATLTTL